ncbi:NAD kinase [Tsukamurella sp. 8J]|uniref:NAD kinase n=1 Tax=Tsukamurella sp. 8J TaxID=3031962 RepID=UPI0023B96F1C|nr:NAD kinase [Tsukamurella sp. 8J]MDF0532643.1 NAD kinase [Tsukamurella sp. 8J]
MEREFLALVHTRRTDVGLTVAELTRRCEAAGAHLRVLADVTSVADADEAGAGCEAVIVLGGDGGFLRGAEIARANDIPILGINLGHVGFLADAERESAGEAMDLVLSGAYTVQPRMTLDVTILDGGGPVARGWALNEVSIENRTRQGLLELVTEVDHRPVSRFACDGVLVSTPTGSTAYAFSAGGPVMWPDLEAMLLVPSNAHALFARPMVTSPQSSIAVEVEGDGHEAIAFCDGRRVLEVPVGGRIEIVRGRVPVRFVRLDATPFTDRLVHKFELPVAGWRGRVDRG